MRHVFVSQFSSAFREYKAEETGVVHYDGPGIISGAHTLCGHIDWVGCRWEVTTKRVNCRGCIGVRDHVLGKQL